MVPITRTVTHIMCYGNSSATSNFLVQKRWNKCLPTSATQSSIHKLLPPSTNVVIVLDCRIEKMQVQIHSFGRFHKLILWFSSISTQLSWQTKPHTRLSSVCMRLVRKTEMCLILKRDCPASEFNMKRFNAIWKWLNFCYFFNTYHIHHYKTHY